MKQETRDKRLEMIDRLIDPDLREGLQKSEGVDVWTDPKQYLGVVTILGEISFAIGCESLAELAKHIEGNASYALDEWQVWDLDTFKLLEAETRVVAFKWETERTEILTVKPVYRPRKSAAIATPQFTRKTPTSSLPAGRSALAA